MLKKSGIKYCLIPLLYYKTIEELKEQPEQEELLSLWCLNAVNKILTKVFKSRLSIPVLVLSLSPRVHSKGAAAEVFATCCLAYFFSLSG